MKERVITPLSRLVERRLADLDISAAEAARRGGLKPSVIPDIFRGKNRTVQSDTAEKLAKALAVPVELVTDPKKIEDWVSKAAVVDHNRMVAATKPGTLIPEIDIRAGASYGGGAGLEAYRQMPSGEIGTTDATRGDWMIPDYVLSSAGMRAAQTNIFEVDGPSMLPDLDPSDRVVCDLGDTNPGRDGIFALWDGDTQSVVIKNVQVVRGTDPPRIKCTSSNPLYEPFEVILDGSSRIIGRLKYRITRI